MPDSFDKSASKHENFVWSRVMSLPQFSISGVFANKLTEDLEEAKEEINAADIEYSKACANGAECWQLLYNPKDYELPDHVVDVEAYRLSAKNLEELGIKVAHLRQ